LYFFPFLDLLTSVFFLLLSLLFFPSSPDGSSCDWAAAALDLGCFFGCCYWRLKFGLGELGDWR
jgi:hypothetical protein